VKIAVTGSSGLIGSALVPALRGDGHTVLRLVRRATAGPDELRWDPAARRLDPVALAGVDAVVNLAGVGIGDRRWTADRKNVVLASRVDATETLSAAMAAAEPRPRALLSASAIGWYGDTGDTAVDESAPAGQDFLAEVCRRWEAATRAAEEAGIRVAHLRSGLVCGKSGGLLGRLLPLARLGLASPLGSGRQWWSWISLADEVGAIRHVLADGGIAGAVNLTGPDPVTNREFTTVLGRVVHRPVVLPAVPRVALRLAIGEFADVGIVAGQRVLPRVLQQTGYRFRHETVEQALRWATGAAQ
jgi:uncharacterized protein (TIGR01777 family)